MNGTCFSKLYLKELNCLFYSSWLNVKGMSTSITACQLSSKCIEGSSHYLGDKQDFDVSSKGPSSGNPSTDEGPLLETSKFCLSPR